MAQHNEVGKNGEELAAAFLVQKGYTIVQTNWRYSHYEIDIVAQKGNKLHFIEVKTLSSGKYGYPEQSVTKKKFKFLQKAADEYLHRHPGHQWIQYDIVSITFIAGQEPEYFLMEDIFL